MRIRLHVVELRDIVISLAELPLLCPHSPVGTLHCGYMVPMFRDLTAQQGQQGVGINIVWARRSGEVGNRLPDVDQLDKGVTDLP